MTLTSKMQDVHRFSVILSSNSLCWASRIVMRLFLVPSNYIYIYVYIVYTYIKIHQDWLWPCPGPLVILRILFESSTFLELNWTELNAVSEWLEFFGTGALFRYPLQAPGAHLCNQQHMRVIPQRRFSTFFSNLILCSNKCRQWLSFRTPVDISFRPRLICCRRRAV